MSSRIIPKEELTAYQRWELGGFDEPLLRPETGITSGIASEVAPASGPLAGAECEAELTVPVQLPTAEDIERIHQEAYQEGHTLGLTEGRRQGEQYSRQLKTLFDGMTAAKLAQDEALARELMEFGLVLARRVVGTVFTVKPELILATIKEALAQMPHLSGHPRLVAHPAHAQLLRDWLAQEHPHLNWRISEDPGMAPGGFRIEAAQGELDADLAQRWKEVLLALGADPAWLEE